MVLVLEPACWRHVEQGVEAYGEEAFCSRSLPFLMNPSAGSFDGLTSLRTCTVVSFRCPARNMETTLLDPNRESDRAGSEHRDISRLLTSDACADNMHRQHVNFSSCQCGPPRHDR